MDVGFPEEQRQTLHSFEGVEVVHALMEAVHAVLVLKHRLDSLECQSSPGTDGQWFYLRQPGQDGGAAGGAAADRCEGIAEHQTTLSQSTQVGSVHHRVVIHLCLKTGIVGWTK